MLVLRPGALGDALLAVPALRALRPTYGHLTLAGHATTAHFLASVGEIDRGLAFDDPTLVWLFTGPPRQESVVAWMAERPRGLPAGSVLAASRPPGMDRHCGRYLLETLAPLGIDLSVDDHSLDLAPADSDEILVHPGSGSRAKNWPAERFASVIRSLKSPVRLIVGEADNEAATRLEKCLGHRLERLESPPLNTLAERLAGCRAYLGNDSGVSHLAGLSGAPTTVMFGPTDANVWRPIGPEVHVLEFETPPREVAARLEGR
ncbi:MAG: glycosyltransferase family 9 protein [Chloroflexi bacterium]|nr:glycosyltransferase family 9 protein [Chloroflexota bacterium]